jgi:hypothetical protein
LPSREGFKMPILRSWLRSSRLVRAEPFIILKERGRGFTFP